MLTCSVPCSTCLPSYFALLDVTCYNSSGTPSPAPHRFISRCCMTNAVSTISETINQRGGWALAPHRHPSTRLLQQSTSSRQVLMGPINQQSPDCNSARKDQSLRSPASFEIRQSGLPCMWGAERTHDQTAKKLKLKGIWNEIFVYSLIWSDGWLPVNDNDKHNIDTNNHFRLVYAFTNNSLRAH